MTKEVQVKFVIALEIKAGDIYTLPHSVVTAKDIQTGEVIEIGRNMKREVYEIGALYKATFGKNYTGYPLFQKVLSKELVDKIREIKL